MKKIITLLAVLFVLCACGQKNESKEENPVNPHGYEIVAIEAGRRVLYIQVDHSAVGKTVIFGHDRPGDLIVAERNEGLDPVLMALVKDPVIESEPLLAGFFVIAVGKDPPPVDGQAETRPAHLCKQSDVFFIAVIKIHSLMARIKRVGIGHRQKGPRMVYVAPQQHIRH